MKAYGSIVALVASASLVTAFPHRLSKRQVALGSCTNPAIQFQAGSDASTGDSFQPVDTATFGQVSAQDVGAITKIICDQLNDQCEAGQDAIAACAEGQAAADAAEGQAA
ncbi:MAG: hypothetical protein M1833_002454, partial [Piccolia ochrophora]